MVFEISETLLAVLEIFLKLRDAAAFAVDAVAFAVQLLERMLLDPEPRFANQSHLWFARHLRGLDSGGGGAKGPTWICAMRGSHEPRAERCGLDRYRATRHYLCNILRASAHTRTCQPP